jgi:uncharacterized protein
MKHRAAIIRMIMKVTEPYIIMEKTIKKMVDYIVYKVDPEKIILFGSMASGNMNLHSDIDLLIVVDNADLKESYAELVENYARTLSVNADVLIYERMEIEKASLKANSFIRSVIKSGKNIYEKDLQNFGKISKLS